MTALEFAAAVLTIALEVPMSATSWGRTRKHNAASHVMGVVNSHHLRWCGLDVELDDRGDESRLFAAARRVGLEVIVEEDHYHLEPK